MPPLARWGLLLPKGSLSPGHLRQILQPRPGERILEIGPGIGAHALPIAASLAPTGTLDVLEIQQPMLDHLLRRVVNAGVINIAPAAGDGQRLPYAAARFDAAHLIDVLGEIPDSRAVLRELRRVLKSDGRLVVGEHFVDPDFVSLRSLKKHADSAGFVFEGKSGTSLVYLARFPPEVVGILLTPCKPSSMNVSR